MICSCAVARRRSRFPWKAHPHDSRISASHIMEGESRTSDNCLRCDDHEHRRVLALRQEPGRTIHGMGGESASIQDRAACCRSRIRSAVEGIRHRAPQASPIRIANSSRSGIHAYRTRHRNRRNPPHVESAMETYGSRYAIRRELVPHRLASGPECNRISARTRDPGAGTNEAARIGRRASESMAHRNGCGHAPRSEPRVRKTT